MRKFYKVAEAGTAPGGHVVRLDGKTIKTPLQHNMIVGSAALAEAMAMEWSVQKDFVIPATMPMTQLVNVMLDKTGGEDRREMNRQLTEYGSSDLVCYFATHPDEVVKRQENVWSPLVTWMKDEFDITLGTVSGIQYHTQTEEDVRKIDAVVSGLEAVEFTAVQVIAGVTGSLTIALAMVHGRLNVADAYEAACVDEIYQLEKWGDDKLAQDRLDNIKKELETAALFLELVKASS